MLRVLICITAAQKLNDFSSASSMQNETLCDEVLFCSDMSHWTMECSEPAPRQPGTVTVAAFCSTFRHSSQETCLPVSFQTRLPHDSQKLMIDFVWPPQTITELSQGTAWDTTPTYPEQLKFSIQYREIIVWIRYYKLLNPYWNIFGMHHLVFLPEGETKWFLPLKVTVRPCLSLSLLAFVLAQYPKVQLTRKSTLLQCTAGEIKMHILS